LNQAFLHEKWRIGDCCCFAFLFLSWFVDTELAFNSNTYSFSIINNSNWIVCKRFSYHILVFILVDVCLFVCVCVCPVFKCLRQYCNCFEILIDKRMFKEMCWLQWSAAAVDYSRQFKWDKKHRGVECTEQFEKHLFHTILFYQKNLC
jgi:hypothetical protein